MVHLHVQLYGYIIVTLFIIVVTICIVHFSKKLDAIRTEIRSSVQPRFIQYSPEVKNLVELAKEIWRLDQRLVKHCNTEVPENQKKSIESSLRKLHRYLETNDIEIRDYTNQYFNEGLNVEVISTEKGASDKFLIKETVEPTVFFKGNLVNKSKVILASK